MSVVILSTGYYPDPTIGRPISEGYIYVGEPDTDPEIVGNQKQIRVLEENGSTTPVSQPLRTSAGGVPTYDGSPVTVLVDGQYSLKVLSKTLVQKYYIPTSSSAEIASFDTVADVRSAGGPYNDNQSATLIEYYDGLGSGGGQLYWDAASVEADDGGFVFKDAAIATGRWKRPLSGIITTVMFGDKEDGVTENSAEIQAALDSGVTEVIKTGISVIGTTLVVPSGVTFTASSKSLAGVKQSAIDTPLILIQTQAPSEYTEISGLKIIILQTVAANTITTKGIAVVETRRSTIRDNYIYVEGHTADLYAGIGIFMDMEDDADSYTNRIVNNTVIACSYGLWSKGPITSSVFDKNHFKCRNGMRFDRGTDVGGSAPIVGNQIINNLIQAHSSATYGTGNGIDFGQSDTARTDVFAFSNHISLNYIEQFLNGIIFREGATTDDGAKNNYVGPHEWDNNVADIVDLNTNKDGYSGTDSQNYKISTKDQIAQFTPQGLLVTDKKTDDNTYWGLNKDLDIDGNGVVIATTDAHRIRIDGNGGSRTGAVLSRASAIEGQRIILIGVGDDVAFSTTGLTMSAPGLTLGDASGEVARIEFEFDTGLASWIECSRLTRL